jgi:hypothetical protein
MQAQRNAAALALAFKNPDALKVFEGNRSQAPARAPEFMVEQ